MKLSTVGSSPVAVSADRSSVTGISVLWVRFGRGVIGRCWLELFIPAPSAR